MSTKIYLIRHGESLGNLNRVVLGHTDLPLTEKGRAQAALTASALADVSFDAIYSSDLCRAVETAAPNAAPRNMQVVPVKELRELYFGDWENASVADLLERCPEMYKVAWRGNFGTFIAPNGESVVALADRAVSSLEKIAREHDDGCVLVASHAALIRALWAKISGLEPSEWAEKVEFPTNASYSVVEFDGERFIPLSYSNDRHLGDLVTAIMKVK